MELVCPLAIVAMVVVGAAGMGLLGVSDRVDRAKVIADELGLSVQGTDELAGAFDGVGVRMYSRDHGSSSTTDWWTYTRCSLVEALPEGMTVANQGFMGHLADLFGAKDIQLGNDLDPKLRIGGTDDKAVRALLTAPAVDQALRELLGSRARIELRSGELLAKVPGRHLENTSHKLREAVALVHALDGATRGVWRDVAARRDLACDAEASRIEGEIRGVWVTAEMKRGKGRYTAITAAVEPALPHGTDVRHKDRIDGGQRLGDPILDAMVAARTDDPATLARRLCTDAVRGPLLEVVHGFPGSSLQSEEVWLVAAGRRTDDLERALDAVADLVLALRGSI